MTPAPHPHPTTTDRWYQCRAHAQVAGVCSGLAEHKGWDPTLVRVAAIVLALLTAVMPLLVVYLVIAIVLPKNTSEPRRRVSPVMWVGWAVLAAAVIAYLT